ncbi:hypothetical protein FB567DRAFT_527274 [Paraphoma chrysanthemicola]|uniref:MYND-type domain-containing protein n=1 Tax=Paraphoma chrysanthemicola TaxID=798071 RepID=A0A8K0R5X4_9PLEO|nr:hypothetical protein FB567DRAFT_527274 [Paraphoma chrysanthemicola]
MASNKPQDFGQPLVLEDFIPVQDPVTFASPPLCATCHTPISHHQRCSTCKNINYCSKECQVHNHVTIAYSHNGTNTHQSTDWPHHKSLCKSFTRSTPPTNSSRRALFFSDSSSRPRFIHLTYATDGKPLDINNSFPATPAHEIKTIGFHNRYLPYWIQLSYDSNATSRVLPKNSALGYAFRGPVVAVGYDPVEGLSAPAVDVDTRALGPVVGYARLRERYRGVIFVEQPQGRWTVEEWGRIVEGRESGDGV